MQTDFPVSIRRSLVLLTMMVWVVVYQDLSAQEDELILDEEDVFLADYMYEEIPDNGNFILDEFGPSNDPRELDVRKILIDSGEIEDVIDDINAEFNLQESVKITFISAPGVTNPMYDGKNQIIITYAFAVEVSNLFADDPNGWIPSVTQLLLHEIGHALVNVNNIGEVYTDENREVVADQLAFFVMSEFYESDADLRKVEAHYNSRAMHSGAAELNAASGKHLPDSQRAAVFRCWIEGRRQWLAEKSGRCRDHYEQLVSDWDVRLEPTWKQSFGFED